MKILFNVYPSAFQSPGGGEVQLRETEKGLVDLGVEVKRFDLWGDHLKDFDLMHTFGSVKECYPLIHTAKSLGVKSALSTICWYSWKSAWYLYQDPKAKLDQLIRMAAKVAFSRYPSDRRKMMLDSDVLFPNSQTEADQLKQLFGIPEEKITVVPNGVDVNRFATAKPEPFLQALEEKFGRIYKGDDFVLVVGRIEPRKNQLKMIRALNKTGLSAVFVGPVVAHHSDYAEECYGEAGKNIFFWGPMDYQSPLLESAYSACNTFLLASWLETPGLAALEAGVAGARVVITCEGATREYFRDHALYVTPENESDIAKKVLQSYAAPKSIALKEFVESHYSWEQVAMKTIEGYKQVLKK